jgi:dTMP kinase
MFIVIEGNDGAGKTTIIEELKRFLEHRDDYVFTRSPGGTKTGADIRQIVLDPNKEKIPNVAELLLFMADRSIHVEQLIKPALKEGKVVIADRYEESTYAYQVIGGGAKKEDFEFLTKLIMGDFKPDLNIFLICPPDVAKKRLQAQGRALDRFEQTEDDFKEKVYESYLQRGRSLPNTVIVDARSDKQHVLLQVLAILKDVLGDRLPGFQTDDIIDTPGATIIKSGNGEWVTVGDINEDIAAG